MERYNQGMTLIEVLVAFTVLAIGMLGIAGMLLLSSKVANSSYAKQQAVQCVYDIFDKIRANYQAAIAGNYTISNISSTSSLTLPSAPSTLCNQSTCTPAQLAAYDTWYWLTNDVSKLPNGSGSITTAAAGAAGNTLITITIQWDDSLAQKIVGASNSSATANPNYVQLSIQSLL